MNEIPVKSNEKYQNLILKFLCERQNYKIKNNAKDIAFGVTDERLESVLKEINEGPCKENPISKEILSSLFDNFLKDGLIEISKDKENVYTISKKAYEAVNITKLEISAPPKKSIRRKRGMEIHENIKCRVCLMTDGYTPKETKCRYCTAPLRRI